LLDKKLRRIPCARYGALVAAKGITCAFKHIDGISGAAHKVSQVAVSILALLRRLNDIIDATLDVIEIANSCRIRKIIQGQKAKVVAVYCIDCNRQSKAVCGFNFNQTIAVSIGDKTFQSAELLQPLIIGCLQGDELIQTGLSVAELRSTEPVL